MSIKSLEGGVLINKSTLLRVLQATRARDLNKASTLFDAGYEQAKTDIARILGREFQLNTTGNPTDDFIRDLKQ